MKHEGEQQFDWIGTVFKKWARVERNDQKSQRRQKSNGVQRLVVFTHIPFWKFARNEAVRENSSLERETLGNVVTDRFFELVDEHLNGVEMSIFSGHVHRDIVSMGGLQVIQNALSQNWVENENNDGFECRFMETGGYRLAKVTDQGLETRFFKFDETANDFQSGFKQNGFKQIGFETRHESFWYFLILTVIGLVLIYLIKTKLKKSESKRF